MPTPLVYQNHLYVLKNQNILACYDLRSGAQRYETRLADVANGFSASPIAADGKIYLSGEDGDVLVVKAKPQFELLNRNPINQPLMATPAISRMMLVGASATSCRRAVADAGRKAHAAMRRLWRAEIE
jgi:hypothetical protein